MRGLSSKKIRQHYADFHLRFSFALPHALQLAKCRKIFPVCGMAFPLRLPIAQLLNYRHVLLNFLQNFALPGSFCVSCANLKHLYMYVFVGDPLGEITVLTPNLTTPFHTQTNYAQTTFVQHCVYVTHYCGPSVSARVCVLIRFSCKKTDQRVSHTSVDHIRTHTHKHIRTHCQLYRKREICTFACKNFRGLVVQLYACILRS